MAFADIVVADATPTNQTFRAASMAQGKAVYTDASRGILEPRSLSIGHQKTGKGASTRVRSVVRFDDVQTDTDGVTPASASVYLVIDRPGIVSEAADINHLITMLKNLLTAGNVTTLLAGQQL